MLIIKKFKKLEDAIKTVDKKILNYIASDDDIKGSEGVVEYREEEEPYTQKIIYFASNYVGEEVIKSLKKTILSRLRAELETCTSNGISNPCLGTCFEQIAHKVLLNGGYFNVRSLEDEQNQGYTVFEKRDKIFTFSSIDMIENNK